MSVISKLQDFLERPRKMASWGHSYELDLKNLQETSPELTVSHTILKLDRNTTKSEISEFLEEKISFKTEQNLYFSVHTHEESDKVITSRLVKHGSSVTYRHTGKDVFSVFSFFAEQGKLLTVKIPWTKEYEENTLILPEISHRSDPISQVLLPHHLSLGDINQLEKVFQFLDAIGMTGQRTYRYKNLGLLGKIAGYKENQEPITIEEFFLGKEFSQKLTQVGAVRRIQVKTTRIYRIGSLFAIIKIAPDPATISFVINTCPTNVKNMLQQYLAESITTSVSFQEGRLTQRFKSNQTNLLSTPWPNIDKDFAPSIEKIYLQALKVREYYQKSLQDPTIPQFDLQTWEIEEFPSSEPAKFPLILRDNMQHNWTTLKNSTREYSELSDVLLLLATLNQEPVLSNQLLRTSSFFANHKDIEKILHYLHAAFPVAKCIPGMKKVAKGKEFTQTLAKCLVRSLRKDFHLNPL